MKWFKHDSDAHSDAKLEKILMKYGADGYAIYWYCLELIAGKLERGHYTFELEHDAELIGHKLRIDTLRVEEIMKYMISVNLFQINPETQRVVCLQLSNRLDNAMSQNPEIQRVITDPQFQETLRNFKSLNTDKSRIDKIRNLNHIRGDTLSGKPDDLPDFDVNCKAIILLLNKLAGTHFRDNAKGTRDLIRDRLKEKLTLRDFEKVIKIKVEQWADDEKWKGYLRPETLFKRNHFESYRNEWDMKYGDGADD